jgi:hypothetical protein
MKLEPGLSTLATSASCTGSGERETEKATMGIWVWVPIVGLSVVAFVAQRRLYLAQYLFFLRYPLLLMAALIAGPPLAIGYARELAGNLFVLDGYGVTIVSALAYFVASTTSYTFYLIFALTPARTKLPLFRREADLSRNARASTAHPTVGAEPANTEDPAAIGDLARALGRQAEMAAWLAGWHYVISAALVLPLCCILALYSTVPTSSAASLAALGALLGAATAYVGSKLLVGWLSAHLDRLFEPIRNVEAAGRIRVALSRLLLGLFDDGFDSREEPRARLHYHALLFAVVSALLYSVTFVVLAPSFASETRTLADSVPPLAYGLMLMMPLGWLLAFSSFYLDKYRIPPLWVLVGAGLFSYAINVEDSYFSLYHPPEGEAPPPASCALSPGKAFGAWLTRQPGPGKPTLVLVAASGGGITASLWTARVLTALASDGRLGPELASSIAMISSASGGGVGAAYFIDAYQKDRPLGPDRETLERVVTSAGASSLSDTAFAIAYSELFRLLIPAIVRPDSNDRGRALELSWGRRLSSPDLRLSDWRVGVEEGWRPAQIFNVTIAETGERMLLGTVDCPTAACQGTWRGQSLPDLYGPNCDLHVATAARLSATFPWITPLSRARFGKAYHLADGGYYDNFGVVTAIEWLTSLQAEYPLEDLIEKVLIVQIRASDDERRAPEEDGGWVYATAGPLLTVLNVRTTSQRNNNEAHLLGIKAVLAQQGVALEAVDFELGIDSPLSWHLTRHEQEQIVAQWNESPGIRSNLDKLVCLWRNGPGQWTQRCGTQSSINLRDPNAGAEIFRRAVDEVKAAERQLRMGPP